MVTFLLVIFQIYYTICTATYLLSFTCKCTLLRCHDDLPLMAGETYIYLQGEDRKF